MSEKKEEIKILQLCHGPVIPSFISAYSLRCHSLIPDLKGRILSTGGPILGDANSGNSSQFRSIILTFYSILKGKRSFEILLSRGKFIRKRYLKVLREEIKESSVVIFEGPWHFYLVEDQLDNKIVVYDAHNSESRLRASNPYHDETEQLERRLVKRSDIVFSVTANDMEDLKNFDSSSVDKFHLVPHVLPEHGIGWKGASSREISFIGSMYGPNISALKFILSLAGRLPEFHFNIIGNVRTGFFRKKLPNVTYHGIIDDNAKDELLANSMLALNPVSEGSGRNVKMVDYLLHSVPIITTSIGVRGFEEYGITDAVKVARTEEFYDFIKHLDSNREDLVVLSSKSRKIYEEILKKESVENPSQIIMDLVSKKKSLPTSN